MTTRPMTDRDPPLFEKFEIIECLKKDSHSGVYLAHHLYLGKKIILKTLDTANIPDSSILKRFKREARILAGLDHPNIIKVLDFGTFGSHFYISFEYFDSVSLREAMLKKPSDLPQKIRLAIQLLRGLEFAHGHQIIHRDVKPENILVNEKNDLKIADFGLARIQRGEKITQKTSIVGTPGYMSPEQIRGEELTPSSDLFSVGIILCELFSGKNPFLGRDVAETINNILTVDASAAISGYPELLESIRLVTARLLQKDERQRFRTATEVIDQLTREFHQILAIEESPPGRSRKFRRSGIIAALLLSAALAAGVLFRGISFGDAPVLQRSTAPRDEPLSPPSDSSAPDRESLTGVVPLAGQAQTPPEMKEIIPRSSDNDQAALRQGKEQRDAPAFVAAGESRPGQNPPVGLPGSLFIECLPWAEVYIDSRKVNTTPLESGITLPPGEHLVQLNHPYYPVYTRQITITSGQQLTVSVDLDTLFGHLDCRVYPWGEIFIDGRSRGQTPLTKPLAVTPGEHWITIINPQFPNFEDSIFVVRQETLQVWVNFETLYSH